MRPEQMTQKELISEVYRLRRKSAAHRKQIRQMNRKLEVVKAGTPGVTTILGVMADYDPPKIRHNPSYISPISA